MRNFTFKSVECRNTGAALGYRLCCTVLYILSCSHSFISVTNHYRVKKILNNYGSTSLHLHLLTHSPLAALTLLVTCVRYCVLPALLQLNWALSLVRSALQNSKILFQKSKKCTQFYFENLKNFLETTSRGRFVAGTLIFLNLAPPME